MTRRRGRKKCETDDKRLKEYKIADAKVQKLDDQFWKTFSVIGIILTRCG